MARNRLWNANIEYHPLLLKAIPKGAQRVLDVGCGDGILSAQLIQAGVRCVVGLDTDESVLVRARARHSGLPVEWRHGDIFEIPASGTGQFDAVLSVAALHHMDAAAGLARFAELVRPGGVVAVVGLAANNWWDLPCAAAGQCLRAAVGIIGGYWEHSAPMAWPPPATYREMKEIARHVLPGVRYKRRLLSRYTVVWTKPE